MSLRAPLLVAVLCPPALAQSVLVVTNTSPGAVQAAVDAAVDGDTVLVHGGLLPEHVRYGIDRINEETAAWMRGDGALPAVVDGPSAPVWTRVYSDGEPDCASLQQALAMVGAARLVVAHTPQEQGVNAACDGRVWRVDTGMSKAYGGPVQVLEVRGGQARVLREP